MGLYSTTRRWNHNLRINLITIKDAHKIIVKKKLAELVKLSGKGYDTELVTSAIKFLPSILPEPNIWWLINKTEQALVFKW